LQNYIIRSNTLFHWQKLNSVVTKLIKNIDIEKINEKLLDIDIDNEKLLAKLIITFLIVVMIMMMILMINNKIWRFVMMIMIEDDDNNWSYEISLN
jgi:hypothetical protein